MIFKDITIISGGQSGVDRAALDFALENNILCGGWCPLGRLAEDGIISNNYPLKETTTSNYEERTNLNVRDSDGTIIIYKNEMDKGTLLTREIAQYINKHLIVINLSVYQSFDQIKLKNWITQNKISVLNIAGPRESFNPGIYKLAHRFLLALL
ncbi:MAG: putative molybdenum carrier protein [Bacteroidetes bacterium]|nr:putative molybdenum carrier protein [Bacteroidota bacterium]MBL6943116.1 putative molybdenum carrier protein [Bacteroidales bacterium]